MTNIKDYDIKADMAFHRDEMDRCLDIIRRHCDLKDKLVLDVGSGTGLHTGFITACGCEKVIGVDLLDYEDAWDGSFKKRLIALYGECGYRLEPARCQFIRMNAEKLLFADETFDIVISVNAFEHIGDPGRALSEIRRVLKRGGYAFIQFDPIYYCDTGGHMFDFVGEPWGHLMHSEGEYIRMLENANAPAGVISDFMHGINRKPRKYFAELFHNSISRGEFKKVEGYEWSGVVSPDHLEHPNFKYLGDKYSKEDLLFRGMNFLLKKN